MSRQPLDLGKLDQFTPRPRTGNEGAGNVGAGNEDAGNDATGHEGAGKGAGGYDTGGRNVGGPGWAVGFPSREPIDEAQLNIKLPRAEAARFRHLAKTDRYTMGAFLTLLMDRYEGRE